MKQKDIIIGDTYGLVRMQYKNKKELNGIRVKVLSKKPGKTDHKGMFPNMHRRKPAHYITDIGIKVMACNLEHNLTSRRSRAAEAQADDKSSKVD